LKLLNTIPYQRPADKTPPIFADGPAANVSTANPQRPAVVVAHPDGGQEFRRVPDRPGVGIFITGAGFSGGGPSRIGTLARPVGNNPLHHLRHRQRSFGPDHLFLADTAPP